MADQNTTYWELIVKEKAGKLSAGEGQLFEKWKAENPESFLRLTQLYDQSESQQQLSFDPADSWDDLKIMIRIQEEEKSTKSVRLLPWFARAAAAVLIIVGISYIYQNQSSESSEMVMQAVASTSHIEQKELLLPDGTKVWMNRNSELLYPENFMGDTRTVYLKGEAFFDVAHNKEQPFTIHAGTSKTTVIGTSFNLRAYGKEDDIRLTVVSGKVAFALADNREQVLVTPGNMATLHEDAKAISLGENNDLNFSSWKTNKLLFDDNKVDEMILALERHFDVSISVSNDGLKKCRFTGDFEETELNNILQIVTRAIGSTYEYKDGSYTISGPGCN